jgi:hypothetical protein
VVLDTVTVEATPSIHPQVFTFGPEAAVEPALEVRTDQHILVVHKHLQAA